MLKHVMKNPHKVLPQVSLMRVVFQNNLMFLLYYFTLSICVFKIFVSQNLLTCKQ